MKSRLVIPNGARNSHTLLALALLLATILPARAQHIITLPSASQLYDVEISIRAGSADDPAGKEGTANLVAQALVEGGFGDPKNPVTKEKLATITRPWGDAATPQIRVDKETTTIAVTVPRDAYKDFISQVLKPMLTQPLFQQAELDRLKKETLTRITSGLRLEQQEMLGLISLDDWVLQDVSKSLGHPSVGTVQGLNAITRDDLAAFYKQHYTPAAITIATTVTDGSDTKLLQSAIPASSAAEVKSGTAGHSELSGRHLLIITQPNAIATGIHAGFPISVKRGDPDYWPLFVANTWLGAHRDDFSHLYQVIRAARGYNYGDYSYIEYLAARPFTQFPPPGTPRDQQYFSLWIRPVGHQYAHFILKAMMSEYDKFATNGLTPDQVAAAKVKARVLYLNYAESKGRQLGYRLDDQFYNMADHGYLQTMLASVDSVTPEQVNAAIKKHLQTANMKFIIVTNASEAQKLADDIANNTNITSKTPADYHMSSPPSAEQQAILDQDKQWAAYPLNISRDNIHIVKSDELFETAGIPGVTTGGQK